MLSRAVLSIALAFGLTAVGVYAGFQTGASWEWPFRILLWPASLLTSWIPGHNIGTAEDPVYEGTPLHLIVFLGGAVVTFLLYAVAAFIALKAASDVRSRRA